MKLKNIFCIAVLSTLATVASTSAQDLTGTFLDIDSGVSAKGTFDGTNYRFVNSGLVQFDGFEAFCIEPLQGIPIGEVVDYTVAFTYSTPEVDESISKLVGNYYTSGQSATEAAATQWAIWEVFIDGTGGSLASGNSRALDHGVATLADDYLAQLPGLPTADVRFLSNPTRQDMVITLVPEPASLSLVALSSLLLFRRKR